MTQSLSAGKLDDTYDQVTDYNSSQEEWYARDITDQHAVPHRFDPFSTQHTEHNHKWVHEIGKIPSWQSTVGKKINFIGVIFSKQLHTHHGKYEYYNAQHER